MEYNWQPRDSFVGLWIVVGPTARWSLLISLPGDYSPSSTLASLVQPELFLISLLQFNIFLPFFYFLSPTTTVHGPLPLLRSSLPFHFHRNKPQFIASVASLPPQKFRHSRHSLRSQADFLGFLLWPRRQ